MNTRYTIILVSLLCAAAQAGLARGSGFETALLGNISDLQVPMPAAGPEEVPAEAAPAFGRQAAYGFYAERFPGFYDARGQNI